MLAFAAGCGSSSSKTVVEDAPLPPPDTCAEPSCGACVAPPNATAMWTDGHCDFTCNTGFTRCGDSCADLQKDPANCGACGYQVVSSGAPGDPAYRSCIDGAPIPGWVPITASNAPAQKGNFIAWTGKRIIHVDAGVTRFYDPATDTWNGPLTITGTPLREGNEMVVLPLPAEPPLPERLFVWTGSKAYVLDDSGPSPVWTQTSPISFGGRDYPGLAYGNERVFALWGDTGASSGGGAYVPATDSWFTVASTGTQYCTPVAGYGGGEPAEAPFAWAHGKVVTFGGSLRGGGICMGSHLNILDPVTLSWSHMQLPVSGCTGHRWLQLGKDSSAVFVAGGFGPNYAQQSSAYLVDPLVGATDVSAGRVFPTLSTYSYALYTGRAIMFWGGCKLSAGVISGVVAGGSMGLVDGNSVTWAPLPSKNEPSARYGVGPTSNYNVGSQQELWTGAEAIVWGGSAGANGAKYQPPVGCVCPSDSAACAGVTGTLPTTCIPQ